MYAKVIVEVPSSNTDELFTYLIPKELENVIYIGSRVFVEFGFRKILGFVIEITETIDFEGSLKPILEVVDFEEGLTLEQIFLAKEISIMTKSFLIHSLELMYPSFMKSKIRKYLSVLNYDVVDAEVALMLGFKKQVLITNEILQNFKKIKVEIDKGHIELINDIYAYGKQKRIKYYSLGENLIPKNNRRADIFDYLKNKQEATLEEIVEATSCSENLIRKLVQEGQLVIAEKEPIFKNETTKFAKSVTYNFETAQLKEKFYSLENKPFLLFSNDEAFKLDFYLDLSVDAVKNQKQVLIVTPTILINSYLYRFFKNNLKGYQIFQFSSRLSNHEYYQNYKNVQAQNADIIICTKANIFLPLKNIGLIIMVDFENQNYQIEQTPKYDVLEVLKFRAMHHQSKLMISTSVGEVNAYYQYSVAKYYLLKYIKPHNDNLRIVNMREEYEDLLLSHTLRIKLAEKLKNKQVSMLILNSLGYSSLLLCNACGKVIKCPKCKIGLTYHKEKNLYKCPYCNSQHEEVICEDCKNSDISMYGYGLERLKERLSTLFPLASIYQIDSLTMQSKNAYDEFLEALDENEIDIIIGTYALQSLYNRSIKLIGVINSDSILNLSDYRSSEMCYQLLSKLVSADSEVIVQGYNFDHYAIHYGITNDFEGFYETEIENRKAYLYPPFNEVSRLVVIGDYKDIYYYANYFKKVFNRIIQGECLGPVYITRLKGIQIIIKHQNFEKLSTLIDEVNQKFSDKKLIVNFERYPGTFN